ncbi:hypothetical protein Tco_1271850 [Tanacetum coccineum]
MVVLEQETDKMVEGDGGDLGILDKLIVELGTRLDQGSHKERLDDDDDDLDNGTVDALIPRKTKGTDDVTDSLNESIPEATLTSLVGAQKLVNSPVIDQQGSSEILDSEISHTINVEVPPLVKEDEVNNFKDDLRSLVTQELATTAPQQIEEFLRNYMQNHAITLQPPSRIPIPKLQQKLYTEMKGSPESQATDLEMWVVLKENFESSLVLPNTCRQMVFRKRDHDDHSDDPREGEKNAKKKKTFKGSTSANVTTTSSKQHVQIF